MVPYSVTGKSSTQIQVVYQGVASDSFQKAVDAWLPKLRARELLRSAGEDQA